MRARVVVTTVLTALVLSLSACGDNDKDVDTTQVDSVEAPEQGACRNLTPKDVALPSNASKVVDCSKEHTAETFAVGDLPEDLADVDYDAPELGAFAYQTCSVKFQEFLGADESTVMRTIVSWAWFRPSEKAWDKGARWYRCDVVGGGENSKTYADLPPTAGGLLATSPLDDHWMVCVNGPTVQGAPKVPCSDKHNWRAVTTIKVGGPDDPYPGDHVVEVTTQNYCKESVGGWLGYPPEYDYGYTWFHEGEWKAGNRRSVCWAAVST